ncbi:hypothetical protein FRB99_008516, partial [Tulasnella sp. 403]
KSQVARECIQVLIVLAIAMNFTVDVAVTLLFLLHLRSSRIGVHRMDAALNKLVSITWESAAPPGIAIIVSFALLFSPSKGYLSAHASSA